MFGKLFKTTGRTEASRRLLKEQEKELLVIAYTGALVQLLWAIPDYFLVPEMWAEIFITRMIVVLTVIPLLVFRKKLNISPLMCNLINGFEIAVFSAYCMSIVPLESFPFYALGEVTFFVAIGMIVTWELKYSVFLLALSILTFTITFPLFSPVSFMDMLTNGGVAALTIGILSLIMVNTRYQFRIREITARMELENSLSMLLTKTRENEYLTKELQSKERSVIISDITSSVAHELNTPLSVIIHSTGIINDQLEDLLTFGFRGVNHSELYYLLKLLKPIPTNYSSITMNAETVILTEKLSPILGNDEGKSVARELIQLGVTSKDTNFLVNFLNKENKREYLMVLKRLRIIEEMKTNISSTALKMASIIKDIKKLESRDSSAEIDRIDLCTLIEKVYHAIEHSGKHLIRFDLTVERNGLISQNEMAVVLFLMKLFEYIIHNSVKDQLNEFRIHLSVTEQVAEINIEVKDNFVTHYTAAQAFYNEEPKINNQDLRDINLLILKSMCDELNATSAIVRKEDSSYFNLVLPGAGIKLRND